MKYNELIKILKEHVTDDMFESLVLNMIFNMRNFKIVLCDVTCEESKIYTLQDCRMGKEYYLVINPTCKMLNKNLFPDDKYMIANKDEDTLFYLVNELNGAPHKEYPDNLRWLIPVLRDFKEDKLTAIMNHSIYRFTKNVSDSLDSDYKDYQKKYKELYNKAIDCMLSRLVKEKYLKSKSKWDDKKNRVKLTGEKGKGRVCCFELYATSYIRFSIKEPFNLFVFHLNDESEIEMFVDKVIEMIESKVDLKRINN